MLHTNDTDFHLKRSALWLLGKELDSMAMLTHKALANRLLALSNRFYKLSVLSLALCNKMHYFSQNKYHYRISVLEQPVEMHFQAILTVGISFHKLVFTVKTSCTPLWVPHVTFLYAIPQTEETIIMSIQVLFHHFDNIFYYSENFKNAVLGFSIILAKHWYQKSNKKMPMSPSL